MRITSKDLPQADTLESVLLTVIAVGNGAQRDIDIANSIPNIANDDRQGRYYRNAAELLNFITNRRNNSSLTSKGAELLNNPVLSNPIFIASVLNLNIYQNLLPFLELHPEGLSRQQILDYLQSIADPEMGPEMIPRRISTILSWSRTLGFIVQLENDRYIIQNNLNDDLPIFEIQDANQPLLPETGDLSEFTEIENRTLRAYETIVYLKNQAILERAVISHNTLVNIVARRIRNNGGIPKSNQLIDLAVKLNGDYLFEMKSTTDMNVRSQIRKGISQLYEYRYLQNKSTAKLVLVIEKPLSASNSWMHEYIEIDREIYLIWDGNNELYGSDRARNELPFLRINQ